MEYVIGKSYLDKADNYFRLVNILKDENNQFPNIEVIVNIQIATECYLSSILEYSKNMSARDYFDSLGMDIPHGCQKIYNEIYPKGVPVPEGLEPFDFSLKESLYGMHKDYRSIRYPGENQHVNVALDDINYDYRVLQEVRIIAKDYEKYIENNLQK